MCIDMRIDTSVYMCWACGTHCWKALVETALGPLTAMRYGAGIEPIWPLDIGPLDGVRRMGTQMSTHMSIYTALGSWAHTDGYRDRYREEHSGGDRYRDGYRDGYREASRE